MTWPHTAHARFSRYTLQAMCLAMGILAGSPAAAGETPRYTLGVIPSAPPVALHMAWTPVVERLARDTGLLFDLNLYDAMADFERAIEAGRSDFLFLHPGQMVIAHRTQGYLPLVRGSRAIAGVVFLPTESPVRSATELDGKPVAVVGTKNVCSIFARHLLATDRGAIVVPVIARSTENVYKLVRLGKAEAGIILDVDFATQEAKGQFRLLLTTEAFPPHPLAAHPRLPLPVRSAVVRAMLRMGDDAAGQGLLRAVGLAAPVPAQYARDYQRHEAADIRGLTQWGY